MKRGRYLAAGLVVLAGLAVGSAVIAAPEAGGASYVFEGQYTVADWGTYIDIPFEVPANTTTIKVKYAYAAHDGKPAIIEIGIYDPEKFRGWSSDNKKEFTVAESLELTTDSYLAGEIPPGQWRVELGIPSIGAATSFVYSLVGLKTPKRSSIVTYQVEIELSDQPVGPPFVMPPKKDVVLSTAPGWYRGALHCHSTHSDGVDPLEQVIEFAHDQGLDFIAPTEHNTISHFAYIPELQKRYDDMLILYGLELTSYIGHANIFDYDDMVDYHATNPGYDINAVIDEVHAGGGYYSPNHPASFLSAGIPYRLDDTDWDKVDFYEVVNGQTKLLKFIPNPINTKAVRLWDRMLRDGHRVTAIGGSDDHSAGHPADPITGPIGTPATMVHAQGLSTRGIMDGMAAGHVYILNQGPSDMTIEFTATGGGQAAMMGDRLEAAEIEFRVKIDHAKFKTLRIVENGLSLSAPILSDPFELTFQRRPRSSGYVRLEVKSGPFQELITNPIYYGRP